MTRSTRRASDTADALLAWLARRPVGPAAPACASPEAAAPAPPFDPAPAGGDVADRRADAGPHPPARAEAGDVPRGAPLRLPHTDWLHHLLTIAGPGDALAAFRAAAAGAGLIPWRLDPDRMEENFFHLLVAPPAPQQRSLSLTGARVLAGQLREAVARRHDLALARVGHSLACPLDLHALIPVPDDILALGPDDPAALRWLWERWGTTEALRHVRQEADSAPRPDGANRPGESVSFSFWSADWSPWRALMELSDRWTALRFDLRPTYTP